VGIILLSGLSQTGTAWLRVAVLHDPREFFPRVDGWADPSFTAPLAKTKHERSVVLLQLGIYSLSTPTCTCWPACIESFGMCYFHVFYFRISLRVLSIVKSVGFKKWSTVPAQIYGPSLISS